MFDTLAVTPYILLLPLLVAASALLILPATAAPGARPHALATTLALVLLTGLLAAIASRVKDTGPLVSTQYIVAGLVLLAATLIAAPLIDRTRARGLILAAALAGLAMIYAIFHHLPHALPEIARVSWLHVAILAASVMGLGGSVLLPAHYARFTNEGIARWQEVEQGSLLAGWTTLAGALLILLHVLSTTPVSPLPLLISASVAAIFALLRARRAPFDPRLQKTGEALVAGILFAALVSLTLWQAAIAGLVAGFFASKSEAITNALRIDDPHHITGALFFPAFLGLLAPGFIDLAQLADHLRWAGAALAMGFVGTIVFWPAVMFMFGLAARRES